MTFFFNPYSHQFVRVATCVPRTAVADPRFNLDQTLDLLRKGDEQRVGLMVFPELGISSYAIDDLLQQDALLEAVERGLAQLLDACKKLYPVFAVGAPLRFDGKLYNTAVIVHEGRILGVVPKSYLPNYREFYERRHFTPGQGVRGTQIVIAVWYRPSVQVLRLMPFHLPC
jgi:NAD+ synthase (glutamine-hydrolysing)